MFRWCSVGILGCETWRGHLACVVVASHARAMVAEGPMVDTGENSGGRFLGHSANAGVPERLLDRALRIGLPRLYNETKGAKR